VHSTTRPIAFALNIRSDLTVSVTSGLNLLSTPTFFRAGCGALSASQVYTDYLGCFARWVSGDIDADIDIVVSFPGFVECGSRWSLTPQQRNLIIANEELKLFSTCNQRDSNGLGLLRVGEGANVEIQGRRTKLVDLLHGFGIANDAPDCLADMVCFQSSRLSNWLVDQVMQLACVPLLSIFCNVKNLIASVSKPLKGNVNILTQLFRDLKLAFDRYGLHLRLIKTHPQLLYNKGSPFERVRRLKSLGKLFISARFVTEFPNVSGASYEY
jgi:hypothetical protein